MSVYKRAGVATKGVRESTMASSRKASQASVSDDTGLSPPAKSNGDPQGARRSSFNFLRRQKSGDSGGRGQQQRSASGGKMSKKQKALAQEELLRQQRQAAMLSKNPPRLPTHSPLPQIHSFGGEDARPDSVAIISNKFGAYGPGQGAMGPNPHGARVPPVPGAAPTTRNGEYVDPYSRTESMTHRGRYSYASSAVSTLNSPRRVRRRKDPTPFK